MIIDELVKIQRKPVIKNTVCISRLRRRFISAIWNSYSKSETARIPRKIAWAFRCATQRRASDAELDVLVRGYQRRLRCYREDPQEAIALLEQGESAVSDRYDKVEMAAATTVASILLNLDELIHK